MSDNAKLSGVNTQIPVPWYPVSDRDTYIHTHRNACIRYLDACKECVYIVVCVCVFVEMIVLPGIEMALL